MLDIRPSPSEDTAFANKVKQALSQLQLPYDAIHAKAAYVLEVGIPKLKLIVSQPRIVLRLADAIHKIPRSMREEKVDELRHYVAEATVALEEL